MERVTFSNALGTGLVGHYHSAANGNGIVLVHGFCNDKSSNGRFDALSNALNSAGFAVLAFDCGGCGESDDTALTPEGLAADIDAVCTFMVNKGHHRLGLFGNSLGGSLCLRVRRPEIVAMATTGAATEPVSYDWSEHYTIQQLAERDQTGFLTDPVDGKWRDRVVVSEALLRAFGEASRGQRLAGLTCPVLLIHGGSPDDAEERMLAHAASRAMAVLPPGSRTMIVDGASHGLRGHWDAVNEAVTSWFCEWLQDHADP